MRPKMLNSEMQPDEAGADCRGGGKQRDILLEVEVAERGLTDRARRRKSPAAWAKPRR